MGDAFSVSFILSWSRSHGSKLLFQSRTNHGFQQIWQGKKKVNNKKVMYDFPVDDFTQKENDSLFSSVVRQCKWRSLSRKDGPKLFCCDGNVTSHFSLLRATL